MLLICLGAVMTFYVSTDFLFTTIGATPRRFVTHRLAQAAYAVFGKLPDGAMRHASVGPVIMSLVAIWWVIGICLGWGMIFAGFSDGVRLSDSGEPVGFSGALSHAGHLLSTLGGGITEAEIHLENARNLFRQTAPPHASGMPIPRRTATTRRFATFGMSPRIRD